MGNIIERILRLLNGTKISHSYDKRVVSTKVEYPDYSHLYTPDYTFGDAFYTNLIKTIHWTEKIISTIPDVTLINYSTVLRLTNPAYNGKPFYSYDETYYHFAMTPIISFNYLPVLKLALEVREGFDSNIKDIQSLGQILEFDIDLTTHDGAPCAESEGFVDESDIPPIDTWFYVTKTKLYCWIPTIFIEKMQNAIDVEIFDSYRWIKDSNPSLQFQTIARLQKMPDVNK